MTTYLPIIINRQPLASIFGVETSLTSSGFSYIADARSNWVRYNGLLWSLVEEIKGERDWSTVVNLDNSLLRASQKGIETILIVRSTPTWAQEIPGAACGPIKTSEINAFGQFMYDAVMRYSRPPFNVHYWEIWNEPDVKYVESMADEPFGCWGDEADENYGGGYYAEVLKVIYPMMKAANPRINVLVGGLLLDCDPGPDPNICEELKKDDKPSKYLTGMLENGGASFFDGISFHAYDYYQGALGVYSNANWDASWNTTGPVSTVKAAYIREILETYSVTGKSIINTEAAVICGNSSDPPGSEGCEAEDDSLYEQTKARYVTQSYATSIVDELEANIWYSLYGWRNSGLLYMDSTPRPAYYAYKSARSILQDSTLSRDLTYDPYYTLYEFSRNGRLVWVLWSLDGANHTVTLPYLPLAAYDFMGNPLNLSLTIDITLDPIYLVW